MRDAHPRAIAAAALGSAVSLLLTACSSSSPTQANAPTVHSSGPASSSSPADPTSTSATPVSETSAAAATAGTTACVLVTEQEAGTALGADPGAGQDATSHGASSCIYGTSPMIVTVNLVPTGGKAAYDHIRGLAPAGRAVDVAGVGVAAFGVFTGPAADIWFYKGDALVAIGLITGGATTPPKDQATVLAKTAADRI
jgi:hypothetical protein